MGNWTYWQILERSLGNSEVAGLRRPWCFLPISRSLLPKEIELHSCANMLLVRTCGAKVKLPRIILYPSPSCGSDRAWVTCLLVKQVVIGAVGALTIPTQVSVLLLSFSRKPGQNDDVLSLLG